MRAAEPGVTGNSLENSFADRERLHAKARHHQQQIAFPEFGHGIAHERVDVGVVLIEHASEAPSFVLRHIAKCFGPRVA